MKVNLLALTGFGNVALKTLLEKRVHIIRVYTRQETGEFPYYEEEQIYDLAKRQGILIELVPRTGEWQIIEDVDINICASFHRKLKDHHLKKAKININIHPSLLPSYKGPTPTNWMIHNKESICGITAHFMSNKIDEGEIIYQKEYPLECNTDAELRKFLAYKVKDVIEFIIDNYPNYCRITSKYKESYYPNYYTIFMKRSSNGRKCRA